MEMARAGTHCAGRQLSTVITSRKSLSRPTTLHNLSFVLLSWGADVWTAASGSCPSIQQRTFVTGWSWEGSKTNSFVLWLRCTAAWYATYTGSLSGDAPPRLTMLTMPCPLPADSVVAAPCPWSRDAQSSARQALASRVSWGPTPSSSEPASMAHVPLGGLCSATVSCASPLLSRLQRLSTHPGLRPWLPSAASAVAAAPSCSPGPATSGGLASASDLTASARRDASSGRTASMDDGGAQALAESAGSATRACAPRARSLGLSVANDAPWPGA